MVIAEFLGISSELLLYIVALGAPVLIIGYILWMDIKNAKKSVVLYFSSEKECSLLDKSVEDGLIKFGKKSVLVDQEAPPLLKNQGMFLKTYRPLHIVKWDRALPHEFSEDGIKIISGTNLKNLIENKTLDKLLEPKGQDKMMLLWLALGLVLGVVLGYFVAQGMAAGA